MKRTAQLVILILALLAIALCALRLTSIHSIVFPDSEQEERLHLAFVCGDALDDRRISEYWSRCVQGMRDAQAELGISLSLFYAEGDYSIVSNVYDSAVMSGVDGIICVGVEQEGLRGSIDAAAERGIPTLCLDGDIPLSKRIAYIGTDNYAMGERAAEELAGEGVAQGEVLVLYPGIETPQFEERVQGFTDYMQSHTQCRMVVLDEYRTSGVLTEHRALIEAALGAYPAVSGLFMPGTSLIATIVQQLPGEVAERLRVVCCDDYQANIEQILADRIDAVIAQHPYEMGYRAISVLYKAMVGGRDADLPEYIYTDTTCITRQSLSEAGDGEVNDR